MLIGTERNPKGPDFSKARLIEKNISGARLRFFSPPHKDPFSNIESWEEEADTLDICNAANFKPIQLPNDKFSEEVAWSRIYSSRWEFRGIPLVQGYCGHMNLLVDVNKFQQLPINEGFFDNKIFAEKVFQIYKNTILEDLDEGYAEDPKDMTIYEWPSNFGPVNSQWVNRGGKDWLYFEDQPLVSSTEIVEWHTAIDCNHSLVFRFVISRSAPNAGNAFRIDNRVNLDNFHALMHSIMDSIELALPANTEIESAPLKNGKTELCKPVLNPTQKQIQEAKYVMRMWSAKGYRNPQKGKKDDHRATAEEISEFINRRLQPRPLSNSYPPGEVLNLSSQADTSEAQLTQACEK